MEEKKIKTSEKKKGRGSSRGIASQIQRKIGTIVIAVLLVVAFVAFLVVKRNVITANNEQLTLQSQSAAYQLEMFFSPFVSMTQQQALNTSVISLLNTTKAGEDITDKRDYNTVFPTMVNLQQMDSENIMAVWVGDADASCITQSDRYTSPEGWDITARPWYRAVETDSTVYTEPYVDASTGRMILSVVSPVHNVEDKVIGVSGMDISMDNMIRVMEGYKIGESGYVILLSASGTILYHPQEDKINTLLADTGISEEVVAAIENSSSELVKYKVDGKINYGYVTPVGDTGYMVMSCIPTAQYYVSLVNLVMAMIFVFAVGIVCVIVTMRRTARQIVKPLSELNDTALQLAEGNLDVEIHVTTEDEVGTLGRSIGKTVTRLKEYINYIDEIAEVLAQMAEGRLAIRLRYDYVGEFQKVKDALYHISESMVEVMTNISETSNHVSCGSEDLARAAQSLAEGSETQAASIEELVATAATVTEQVTENMEDSEKSAVHTKEVTTMMEDSQKLMNQMRAAMNKIQESSQQVVGIIQTIEDIAEQTNLLSLNASIEAARAGEAGRGFAVVAGEIGNLANESARAVNTTRDLIGISLSEIEKGNSLTEEVVNSLGKAVARVEEVNGMIQKSAENAVLQRESMEQILEGVEEMSRGIQDNSAMAEETSATSEELAAQAVALNELVSKFELQ